MLRLRFLLLILATPLTSNAYSSADQFDIRVGSQQLGAPLYISFFGFTDTCFGISRFEVSITETIVDDPAAPFGVVQRLAIDARGPNRFDISCDTATHNSWQIEIGKLKAPTIDVTFRYLYPASRDPGATIVVDDIIDRRIQLLNPLGTTLQPNAVTTLDQVSLTIYSGCPIPEPLLTAPRTLVAGSAAICEPEDEVWMARSVPLARLEAGDWLIIAGNRIQNTEASSRLFVPGEVAPASRNNRFDVNVRHAVPTEASGLWYNPEQNGEGLTMLVLDDQRIIAIWYTFNPDGELVWVYGEGAVQAPTTEGTLDVTVSFDAFEVSQSQANLQTLQSHTDLNAWGSWTMVFSACDQASFNWQPDQSDWPAGESGIQQLAGASQQDCQARRTVQ